MTDLDRELRARRILLAALALRQTLGLGPLRFKTLALAVNPVWDADVVARQLSTWENNGLVRGESSLQDGLPEPVYTITSAGLDELDRLRGPA
jgi:hypothetical protein